jgi:hypothetical protein
MTAQYIPGEGVLVTFYGFSAILGEDMTVGAMEKYLKELSEFAE